MKRDKVAELFRDGVVAIVTTAESLDEHTWGRPACGSWDAAETARHVLAVTSWYDEWLDRALLGTTSPPFAASTIDEQNSAKIASLRDLDGPTAIAKFEEAALEYLERAVEHWDVPYAYPFGTVTVGLHLGVAAAEWHLHAADLAAAGGRTIEPHHAAALFVSAGLCVAETKSGWQRMLLRRLVTVGARIRPWHTMLRESGRQRRTTP